MKDNWVKEPISKFGDVISGGTPSTTVDEFWDGDIVWITPADLSKTKFYPISDSAKKITLKGLNNSSANLIPRNSIAMSSRAPIGYFAIPTVNFATNQGCKSIKIFSNQEPLFHYYNFLFNVEVFKRRGEGTTFAEISKKEIEKLEFSYPPRPQQRRIAQILSTCDAVIEKTEAAIAKYQAIKQGLMHDLFTQGIDLNTGKLRPKYEDAPELYKESVLGWIPREWEVKTVDDVAILRHGYQFRDFDFVDGEGIDVIKIGQVGKNGFVNLSNSSKIDKNRMEEFKDILLYNGDILMALTGATLGKTALVKNIDKPLVQNYRVGYFSPKNTEQLNKSFLYYLLIGENVQNEILGFVNAGAQGNIGKADFEKIKVVLASNIVEQELIAERIATLDDRVNSEQTTLSKYRKIKAGLMQDLLSGKVEAKV